jgi:hypothetical protein
LLLDIQTGLPSFLYEPGQDFGGAGYFILLAFAH